MEEVVIKGMRCPSRGGRVSLKVLRERRRADREYPLRARASNRILTASQKSAVLEHMRSKRRSCGLRSPANVCLGWKLLACKSACVSVGLKKTFTSNMRDVMNCGPLNVVVSRKSTEEKCLHDLRVMDGSCVFRMFRN